MVSGVTLADIARDYNRTLRVVEWWRWAYDWPEPVGRAGHWDLYDPEAVHQAVRKILALPDEDADPGELLDVNEAAAEAGLAPSTVRADISRGRWPAPDNEDHGVKRWRRDTVRAAMAARRPNKRRRIMQP